MDWSRGRKKTGLQGRENKHLKWYGAQRSRIMGSGRPGKKDTLNSKPELNFLEILTLLVQGRAEEEMPWRKDHPGNIEVLS
ncbi:unnamed protein product [Bubo scandiacus]